MAHHRHAHQVAVSCCKLTHMRARDTCMVMQGSAALLVDGCWLLCAGRPRPCLPPLTSRQRCRSCLASPTASRSSGRRQVGGVHGRAGSTRSIVFRELGERAFPSSNNKGHSAEVQGQWLASRWLQLQSSQPRQVVRPTAWFHVPKPIPPRCSLDSCPIVCGLLQDQARCGT